MRFSVAIARGNILRRHARMTLIRRVLMWLIKARWTRARRVAVLEIKIIIARDVTRLLRALDLFEVFADDDILNHLATKRVDRVRNIGVQLSPPINIFR